MKSRGPPAASDLLSGSAAPAPRWLEDAGTVATEPLPAAPCRRSWASRVRPRPRLPTHPRVRFRGVRGAGFTVFRSFPPSRSPGARRRPSPAGAPGSSSSRAAGAVQAGLRLGSSGARALPRGREVAPRRGALHAAIHFQAPGRLEIHRGQGRPALAGLGVHYLGAWWRCHPGRGCSVLPPVALPGDLPRRSMVSSMGSTWGQISQGAATQGEAQPGLQLVPSQDVDRRGEQGGRLRRGSK